jgi:hypothetical protein
MVLNKRTLKVYTLSIEAVTLNNLIVLGWLEELDGSAVSALGVRSQKVSNIGQSSDGWPKIYYLLLLWAASEGTLNCWSRLYLQSLLSTNPHWARVVGYGPFSFWVIHKKDRCPSYGIIIGWWCEGLMLSISHKTSLSNKKFNWMHLIPST